MTGSEGAFAPDLTKWEPWRPEEVRNRLAGVSVPWCVSAGWAVDLFLGGQRREHEDIEIAVPHDRFGEIAAALGGLELFVAGRQEDRGVVWPLTEGGEAFEEFHQTWVRDPKTGAWRLDVFRDPSVGDTWICRRDERIRLPYAELIESTNDGIPYQRPEVVLLFKAKHARSKDDGDLDAALPRLSGTRRAWLAEALELVHPGHRWLEQLR